MSHATARLPFAQLLTAASLLTDDEPASRRATAPGSALSRALQRLMNTDFPNASPPSATTLQKFSSAASMGLPWSRPIVPRRSTARYLNLTLDLHSMSPRA